MKNILYSTLLTMCVIYILIIIKSILMPFIFAILLWYLTNELKDRIAKIKLLRLILPRFLLNLTSILLIFGSIYFIISLLISNISEFDSKIYFYKEKLYSLLTEIDSKFEFNLKNKTQNFVNNFDISKFSSTIIENITSTFSNIFMILIYFLFLLLEQSNFKYKLSKFTNNITRYNKTIQIFNEIDRAVGKYLTIKTLLNFIASIVTYSILKLLNVDFAFFASFLVFVLSYIPVVGVFVSTVFPTLTAFLQYGFEEYWIALTVLFSIGGLLAIIGNFIEPKLMGNNLNISSLIVIISLTVWGAIWGIVGMIISVPITVIIIIIFSKIERLKPIAILLSEKGDIVEN